MIVTHTLTVRADGLSTDAAGGAIPGESPGATAGIFEGSLQEESIGREIKMGESSRTVSHVFLTDDPAAAELAFGQYATDGRRQFLVLARPDDMGGAGLCWEIPLEEVQ